MKNNIIIFPKSTSVHNDAPPAYEAVKKTANNQPINGLNLVKQSLIAKLKDVPDAAIQKCIIEIEQIYEDYVIGHHSVCATEMACAKQMAKLYGRCRINFQKQYYEQHYKANLQVSDITTVYANYDVYRLRAEKTALSHLDELLTTDHLMADELQAVFDEYAYSGSRLQYNVSTYK